MGVAGCLWYNEIKAGLMPIKVLLLLKVTHVSAYAAEDTILWILLHYMLIGPFLLGASFIGFGDGQSLR